MDYLLKDAKYVVEATHFEMLSLFGENERNRKVVWKHVSMGSLSTVGTLCVGGKDYPVCVSILFAILDGVLVAFYDAASRVVDHDMVEAWVKAESPAYASGKECNAINFHHCIRALPSLK